MITAVIFDVDGTLVDSVDLHAQAWAETFEEFGKAIPVEQIRTQIGKGSDQLLPTFWSKEEIERIEKPLTERRKEIFAKKYLPKVRGFAGVRPLFQRLLAENKKIALASSAVGEELKAYKECVQITDLLDAETSADDAEKSKPHPDIFEAALHRLGHPSPAETIVIGDTPYDIEAASRAGIASIAVRSGGFPEDTLRGAVAIYQDPADLLAHLDESPLAQACP